MTRVFGILLSSGLFAIIAVAGELPPVTKSDKVDPKNSTKGTTAPPSKTPAPAKPVDPELTALVKKLGDPRYAVRTKASADLLRRGLQAIDALRAGIDDPDLEISERCRLLLPQAETIERDKLLAELVSDLMKPPADLLPQAAEFLKQCGDRLETRELYAEMLVRHPRVIYALKSDPKQAREELNKFLQGIDQEFQGQMRIGRFSYENLPVHRADYSMLFFSAPYLKGTANRQYFGNSSMMFYGNKVQNILKEGEHGKALQKMFVDWVRAEPDSNMLHGAIQLLVNTANRETVPVVLDIMRKNNSAYLKGQLAAIIGKHGAAEHAHDLMAMAGDKTVVTTVGFGNGKRTTVQMRDVAMGFTIVLMKQKPSEFGYDPQYENQLIQTSSSAYIYMGFESDTARDSAHAKWKEYWEKNKPAAPKK